MDSPEQPVLYTEPQAARILNVSARTLSRWRKRGAIGHRVTPGGRVFYHPEDVRRCMVTMQVQGGGGRLWQHK